MFLGGMISPGIWHNMHLVTVDVSEEHGASIFMEERISELGSKLAVTSW
jgi:hypothetical protein